MAGDLGLDKPFLLLLRSVLSLHDDDDDDEGGDDDCECDDDSNDDKYGEDDAEIFVGPVTKVFVWFLTNGDINLPFFSIGNFCPYKN